MERILVTGGAGFIGSHLVDRLVEDYDVIVLDDLSGGDISFIEHHKGKDNFAFHKGSILLEEDVKRAIKDVDTVFHFAAQPDVRLSVSDPMRDFEVNMIGGMTLLESLRKYDITRIVFASSGGTVYGDPEVIPTPEKIQLAPISNYGAAKCAFEMYLSSYCELYDFSAVSMRLGNIIGPRLTHGVIFDFFMKLKKDPTKLEILGTGSQEKTYLYVSDTVDAALLLESNMKKGHLPINVSSSDRLTVTRIAEIITNSLGLNEVEFTYTGSERGWAGDVVITGLDISLLKSFGWSQRVKLEAGIYNYIAWLVEKYGAPK